MKRIALSFFAILGAVAVAGGIARADMAPPQVTEQLTGRSRSPL